MGCTLRKGTAGYTEAHIAPAKRNEAPLGCGADAALFPLRLLFLLEEDVGANHHVLAARCVLGCGWVDAGGVE